MPKGFFDDLSEGANQFFKKPKKMPKSSAAPDQEASAADPLPSEQDLGTADEMRASGAHPKAAALEKKAGMTPRNPPEVEEPAPPGKMKEYIGAQGERSEKDAPTILPKDLKFEIDFDTEKGKFILGLPDGKNKTFSNIEDLGNFLVKQTGAAPEGKPEA